MPDTCGLEERLGTVIAQKLGPSTPRKQAEKVYRTVLEAPVIDQQQAYEQFTGIVLDYGIELLFPIHVAYAAIPGDLMRVLPSIVADLSSQYGFFPVLQPIRECLDVRDWFLEGLTASIVRGYPHYVRGLDVEQAWREARDGWLHLIHRVANAIHYMFFARYPMLGMGSYGFRFYTRSMVEEELARDFSEDNANLARKIRERLKRESNWIADSLRRENRGADFKLFVWSDAEELLDGWLSMYSAFHRA